MRGFAFNRLDEGGFFAADKSARANAQVDAKIGRRIEDTRAEQAELFRLLESDFQPMDRQRIFATHIDIALSGANSISGDGHAFENPMRIAFEDAAVHEGAGVAFVGVAHDELAVAGHLGDEAPLDSCRIAGAASPAQAAARDGVHDLGRRHVADSMVEGSIPAGRNVRFDTLRLDDAGVLQYDCLLFGKERPLWTAAYPRFVYSATERRQNRPGLVWLHFLEQLLRWVDLHQRTRTTQTQAADAADFHTIGQTLGGNFTIERFLDRETARRNAPSRGTAADAHFFLSSTLLLGHLLELS